jgi:hypothetical protein
MKVEVVWIRMGDMGDYESLGDDFDAIGGYLAMCQVRRPFTWMDRGLVARPFGPPADHISIFWGPPDQPEFSRNLTAQERLCIEKAVNQERERWPGR